MIVAVVLVVDVVYLTFVTAFDSSRLAVMTQLLQRSVSAVKDVDRLNVVPLSPHVRNTQMLTMMEK